MKDDPKCTWKANPHANGCFGRNYTNVISKRYAHKLGFDNPNTNTAHGNRKYGSSALVNTDGIGPKLTTNLTRHAHYSTVSTYEKPNATAVDRAMEALQGPIDPSTIIYSKTAAATTVAESPVPDSGSGSIGNIFESASNNSKSNSNSIASINGIGRLGQLTQFSPESNSSNRSPSLPATIDFSNL